MSGASSRRLLGLSERGYRALLAAYPPGFRRAYGPWLAQLFRDCCRAALRERGIAGLIAVWTRALLDLARTAPQERALERRARATAPALEGGAAMREQGAWGRLRTVCSDTTSPASVMLVAGVVWSLGLLVGALALRGTAHAGLVGDFLGGATPLYIILLGALADARRMDGRALLAGLAVVWGMVLAGALTGVVLQGVLERALARDLLIGGAVATVVLLLLVGWTAYAGRGQRR